MTAPIEIVHSLLIRVGKSRAVFCFAPRQPAGNLPESFALHAGLCGPSVRKQSSHSTVAIQEGMNPCQTVMSRCHRDEAVGIRSHHRAIKFREALQELSELLARRRQMAANADLALSQFTGH